MIKQVWREKSLGDKTRKIKPETKSAVSEAQARANAETDIESIVKRTRAAAKAKTNANLLLKRSVTCRIILVCDIYLYIYLLFCIYTI